MGQQGGGAGGNYYFSQLRRKIKAGLCSTQTSRQGTQPHWEHLHAWVDSQAQVNENQPSASPLSSSRFKAVAVAQKIERGGKLGVQKTLSRETKEELGAAMTVRPTPESKVASAQTGDRAASLTRSRCQPCVASGSSIICDYPRFASAPVACRISKYRN